MTYATLDDFVNDLPTHVAAHAEQLRGHDTTALLRTKEGRVRFIRLKDGTVTLSDTPDCQPDCTVTASEKDLLDMINGKLNPVKAVLFRKIVISGDSSRLLALARLA